MSYNKRNRLLIVKKVQDLYLEHKKDGVTTRSIYKNHIYPNFSISISTFYNYCGINAKKELKEFDVIEPVNQYNDKQVQIFSPELIKTIKDAIKEEIALANKELLASIRVANMFNQQLNGN